MKSLCVFCGSNRGNKPVFGEAARELGEAIAARNMELIYGGARVGLMGTVADAALARGGQVIGVMPHFMANKELEHKGLAQLHWVETMHERKQLMAKLSEGFVALPGGFGTLEEIFEAITWAQLHLHAFPCALLNVDGYFDALVEFMRVSVLRGFVRQSQFDSLIVTDSVEELFRRLAAFTPDRSQKWIEKI